MVWPIHYLSLYRSSKENWYESPTFGQGKSKWQLHICIDDPNAPPKGFKNIYLLVKRITAGERVVEYRFGLRNRNGVDKFVHTRKELPMNGVPFITNMQELEKMKEELLLDDTLTVFCEVVHESFMKHLSEEKIDKDRRIRINDICRKELATDLNSLFNDKSYCDVILKSSDLKEFSAHRVILHARSVVFAAMFQHDMVEKRSGEVYMQDIDCDTLQALLDYVYTSEVKVTSQKKASMLYAAADKYQLQGLKRQCVNYMVENMTIDHVCDIVLFARKYGEDDLYKTALEVLGKNAQIVVASKQWKELITKNAELTTEILAAIDNLKGND